MPDHETCLGVTKPCPFCGSFRLAIEHSAANPVCRYVTCSPCETTGPSAETDAEACRLWDRRFIDDDPFDLESGDAERRAERILERPEP